MDTLIDNIDEEQLVKQLEKELKNNKRKESENEKLDAETKAKLQEAVHDKQMLADKDGEIHRVAEIDFIIKDILKHQNKAFKKKRDMEDSKELVECAKGEENRTLENNEFIRSDTASLAYTNEEVVSNQRGVAFYLIKKIGASLLSGKSIMNISLPIKIFESRSMLEKAAESFSLVPYYFLKALEEKDPIGRIRVLITCYIASLQLEPQMRKPFNPILGETFQGMIGEYEIALEQISHHPPILALQMWSNTIKNAPTLSGYVEFEAKTGLRTIDITKNGEMKVYFPDSGQTVISHTFPDAVMHGVIKGTRTYDFLNSMKLSDEQNQIHADVVFNPDKKGWLKRMFTSSQKTRHDHFEGVISNSKELDYKNGRGGDIEKLKKNSGLEVYSKIEGNWTESMKIDDKVVWEYSKFKPLKVRYINNPLPSD